MKIYLEQFTSYPSAVRSAIMFQIAAWLWHYISLYTNLLKGEIPFSHIVIGVFLCYKLLQIRNWARKLCLCFNPPIILLYSAFTVLFFGGSVKISAICFLNVVFFSLATYYLVVKETAEFYKKEQEKDEVLKKAQKDLEEARSNSRTRDANNNS